MAVKRDEHGEYKTDAGSPHPVDPDDVNYVPCNAVLRHTWSRYGERRYCTAMAIENFESSGTETDYDHPEFCKNHQSRAILMKQHEENFKTGAYAKSHEHTFQHLEPHKQLLANDMYKSLLGESKHDFQTEDVELEIDVEDSDFAGPEVDTLVLDHPVPTDHEMRAKALWFAAIDFISMESIRQEQLRVAAEESHEGRSLAIGETTTYIATDDGAKEIVDEHHLNLPLSRIQKDYKEHLKFGGVEREIGEEAGEVSTREWVTIVEPNESGPQPEASSGDSSPMASIDIPDPEEEGE